MLQPAASLPRDDELRLKEAEWVWSEMEDFVRQIQRYRTIYVSALFLSVGWVLGQALGVPALPGASSSTGTSQTTIVALRTRQDIGVLICIIPLINALFVMLMIEALFHIQSLARYRFILGCDFGGGKPVWKWELWKERPEGSVRAWTNPLNAAFFVVALALTLAAFWFPWPAARQNSVVFGAWVFALAFTTVVAVVVGVAGIKNRYRNRVADRPKPTWEEITFSPDPTSRERDKPDVRERKSGKKGRS